MTVPKMITAILKAYVRVQSHSAKLEPYVLFVLV